MGTSTLGVNIFIGLFLTLFITFLIRQFTKTYRIPIPVNVLNFLFGVICGVIYKQFFLSKETDVNLNDLIQLFFDEFYVPLIVFKTAFCVDLHLFQRGLIQIMIITFFVVPFNIIFTGFIMQRVIGPDWSNADAVYFGAMCVAIYPSIMVQLLESTSYLTNQSTILLQGETLFALFVTTTICNMSADNMEGILTNWYDFLYAYYLQFRFSVLIGIAFSTTGIYLMRLFYNDPSLLMIMTMALSFLGSHMEVVLDGNLFGIVMTGAILSRERAFLPKNVNNLLTIVWKLFGYLLNALMIIACGFHIVLSSSVSWIDIPPLCLTYIIDLSGRFIGFLLFSPILSRIGLGLNFQNMIICVWGGIKNPYNLGMGIDIYHVYELKKADIFYTHLTFLFLLNNIINGIFAKKCLKLLGLHEPPMASKINLKNCTKYIRKTRQQILFSLKRDEFFCDVNWPLVETATTMILPYQQKDEEFDVEQYIHLRFARCPHCQINVLGDPSKKELKEMARQGKLRSLKASKEIFKQLFHQSVFSKKVLRTLIYTLEQAIDSPDNRINYEMFYKYFKPEYRAIKQIRKRLRLNISSTLYEPPSGPLAKFCYNLINNVKFTFFMCGVIASDCLFVTIFRLFAEEKDMFTSHLQLFQSAVYLTIYLTEFIIRILAYSNIESVKQFITTYFRSILNVIDFLVLLITALSMTMHYTFILHHKSESQTIEFMQIFYTNMPFIRSIKFLRYITKVLYEIWRAIEKIHINNLVYAFSLAKAVFTTQLTVIDLLPFMIDNVHIQQETTRRILRERYLLGEKMLVNNVDRLDIFASVNTLHAIRTVLKSMTDATNELKIFGFLDHVEHENIMKLITNLYKRTNSLELAPYQSSPVAIFAEIPWLEDGRDIVKFLFDNIDTRKFDPNEEICTVDEMAEGIYIIIRGIFAIKYEPKDDVLERCNQSGCLPVIDHMPATNFSNEFSDFLMQGNCIGELATITHRPYDGIIMSCSYSEVYVLSRKVILDAMEIDSDPIDGLSCRIWKSVAIPVATSILKTIPYYSLLRQNKIKFALERSFVPDLTNFYIFLFHPLIKDIILIEGIAVDYHTREIFYGPVYIPRTVEKLILSSNKLLESHTKLETKLLIIPVVNVDKRVIMAMQTNSES